jgi:hypothetical protein
MSKQLGDLAVGSKIKFGSIFSHSIPWVITDKNHTGYPSGAVSIATEKIIKIMPFDAKEAANGDSNRKNYGNNRYQYANIRKWLNSAAGAGAWYAAAHSADAPPDSDKVTYNAFTALAGFLNGFTQNERDAILNTTLTVGKASVDGGGTETVTDKIFLMSTAEVGLSGNFTEGSLLAYFTDNAHRIAKTSADAAANSDYTGVSADQALQYWLRSPYSSFSYIVRVVNQAGTLYDNAACNGDYGLRPALNLSSSLLISDNPDSDGYYTAIYNYAPTAPSSITVPASIVGDLPAVIQWGAATDTDGTIAGYELERKADSGSWTQIYGGNAFSYTDTINQAWEQVQWRVRAYDNAGENGPYTTSQIKSVIHNQPPAMSIQDGENLGIFVNTKPELNFTVEDVDSDNVLLQYRLDGNLINFVYANVNDENDYTIPDDVWIRCQNGVHQLEVRAIDDHENTVIKTVSFTKAVVKSVITLSTPLAADAMPVVILVNANGSFPEGSNLTVEVCNNAFDEEPAWEDMTSKSIIGKKYFFQNTEKEAEEWGINIRVTQERGISTEPVYITGIGGNYA